MHEGEFNTQSGSSLVEVMLTLAVSVTILASVLTGLVQHSAQRQSNIELALALNACRNTLEELRTVPYEDLLAMDGVGFDVPGANGQAGGLEPRTGDPDGLPGIIAVSVDKTTGTPSAGDPTLYRVQARVEWQGSHRGGQFAMSTLMGERK